MGTSIFEKYPINYNFNGLKVLNLGCGGAQYKFPNVTNLDAFPICNPDVVHDLEETPLPFKDETFDLIIANHILEHVHNWWECFEDCARILKQGGKLEVYVPSFRSDGGLGFRDHVSVINQCSFYGMGSCLRPDTNAWAKTQLEKEKPVQRLHLQTRDTIMYAKWWIRRAPLFLRKWMAEHLFNVINEEHYVFIKK